MKLQEMYEIAVRAGRGVDPRGEKGIARILEEARKAHDDLPPRSSVGVRHRIPHAIPSPIRASSWAIRIPRCIGSSSASTSW